MNTLTKLFSLTMIITLAACSPPPELDPSDEEGFGDNDDTLMQESTRPDKIEMADYQPDSAECQLTMGYEAWEPYQYRDVGDIVRGLDVEIAEAIAGTMNCELTFAQGTWVELLEDLESGDIDLVMGASKTNARDAYAYFSDAYRDEQFVLFVRSDDAHHYKGETLQSFVDEGYNVGIVDDYFYGDTTRDLIYHDDYRSQFKGALMAEFNLVRLLDEDIDGFLEDRAVGLSMIRRKGLHSYIEPSPIELEANEVFVMFSRQSVDESQVESFNDALGKLQESGDYETIMERYLEE
ncbi:substrate-binding periplasmic protein [Aliidiomarina sp. Khilg15.8]